MQLLPSLILIFIFSVIVTCEEYCGQYNCYELLGVTRQSDQATIKKAFRQMARKYHPDKNQDRDTTKIFQTINRAYQVLTSDKLRFKYNLHLQNPEQSDYYHQYRYYSKKYIQNPQIPLSLVIFGVLSLISLLQFVMRKQMYQRAVESITQSHQFKAKVNERCGKDKKNKDRVREQMIEEISIEGGYSPPKWQNMLIFKLVLLPYTVLAWTWVKLKWFYKYTIMNKPYTAQDQEMLTIKALKTTLSRWENGQEKEKKELIEKKLWIKENLIKHQDEMKAKFLQNLRKEKPEQYKMYMKYMKKQQ